MNKTEEEKSKNLILNRVVKMYFLHPVVMITASIVILYCCGYGFHIGFLSAFNIPSGFFPLETNVALFYGGLSLITGSQFLFAIIAFLMLGIGAVFLVNFFLNMEIINKFFYYLKEKVLWMFKADKVKAKVKLRFILFGNSREVISDLERGMFFCISLIP